MKRKRGGIVSQLLMILLVVVIIFPLYFMTANSFKTHEEYVNNMAGLPQTFTVQNFVEAFRGKPFGQWFMNSLILTVAAVFITGIIALLAGYAFAKMRFKGKKVLFNMIVPLMSVPPVVMIIPQFRIIKILGLVNTRCFCDINIYRNYVAYDDIFDEKFHENSTGFFVRGSGD